MMAAAGAAGDKTYVDDLFSIDVYIGNGSVRTINNGIDLAGEGGMVIITKRNASGSRYIFDTVRGANKAMMTNDEQSDFTLSNSLTSFNSNGFTLGTGSHLNNSGDEYVAWTIRKAEKLFTMGTYTGNGNTSQTINHDLTVGPAMMWVKQTNTNGPWSVYNFQYGASAGRIKLNSADSVNSGTQFWNDTNPTHNQLTVGSNSSVNGNNDTYQFYLFSHDRQEFGIDDSQAVYKIGNYTGTGSNPKVITLGWEPQFVLQKAWDTGNPWAIVDEIRGMTGQNARALNPGGGGSEITVGNYNPASIQATATGFNIMSNDEGGGNASGKKYIYWAVRRKDPKVGKPPELGTDVFALDTGNGSSNGPAFDSGFPVDMGLRRKPASGNSGTPDTDWATYNRLLGITYLRANTTDVETSSSKAKWDLMTGFNKEDDSTYQAWMWKRHAGFDVVSDKGNGQTTKQIAHNLNAVPQMIWRKNRDGGSDNWQCYHFGLNGGTNPHLYRLRLNTNNSEDSDSYTWVNAPTSTQFTVGSNGSINRNNDDFITMLFASVDGISKVGSYTGTGNSSQYINVGHEPRFLIIKRTDSTGDWMVFDSLRGFGHSATNDSILKLNSTGAATSSNVMNLFSAGFNCLTSDSNLNASNGKYVYYSHA